MRLISLVFLMIFLGACSKQRVDIKKDEYIYIEPALTPNQLVERLSLGRTSESDFAYYQKNTLYEFNWGDFWEQASDSLVGQHDWLERLDFYAPNCTNSANLSSDTFRKYVDNYNKFQIRQALFYSEQGPEFSAKTFSTINKVVSNFSNCLIEQQLQTISSIRLNILDEISFVSLLNKISSKKYLSQLTHDQRLVALNIILNLTKLPKKGKAIYSENNRDLRVLLLKSLSIKDLLSFTSTKDCANCSPQEKSLFNIEVANILFDYEDTGLFKDIFQRKEIEEQLNQFAFGNGLFSNQYFLAVYSNKKLLEKSFDLYISSKDISNFKDIDYLAELGKNNNDIQAAFLSSLSSLILSNNTNLPVDALVALTNKYLVDPTNNSSCHIEFFNHFYPRIQDHHSAETLLEWLSNCSPNLYLNLDSQLEGLIQKCPQCNFKTNSLSKIKFPITLKLKLFKDSINSASSIDLQEILFSSREDAAFLLSKFLLESIQSNDSSTFKKFFDSNNPNIALIFNNNPHFAVELANELINAKTDSNATQIFNVVLNLFSKYYQTQSISEWSELLIKLDIKSSQKIISRILDEPLTKNKELSIEVVKNILACLTENPSAAPKDKLSTLLLLLSRADLYDEDINAMSKLVKYFLYLVMESHPGSAQSFWKWISVMNFNKELILKELYSKNEHVHNQSVRDLFLFNYFKEILNFDKQRSYELALVKLFKIIHGNFCFPVSFVQKNLTVAPFAVRRKEFTDLSDFEKYWLIDVQHLLSIQFCDSLGKLRKLDNINIKELSAKSLSLENIPSSVTIFVPDNILPICSQELAETKIELRSTNDDNKEDIVCPGSAESPSGAQ